MVRKKSSEDIKKLKERYQKKTSFEVKEPFFGQLKDGTKRFEGRIDRGSWSLFEKDDIVYINQNMCFEKSLRFKIINIFYYLNFEEALRDKGVDKVMPQKTFDEAVEEYQKIYDLTIQEDEGVMLMELERI